MQYDTDYFWVVCCKNRRYHHKNNTSFEHLIRLAETDSYSSLPILPNPLTVRRDNCGEEYAYKSIDVLRNSGALLIR